MCVHKRQKMVGEGDGWVYKKTKGFTLVVNSYKSLNSFIFLKPELSLNVIVTLS